MKKKRNSLLLLMCLILLFVVTGCGKEDNYKVVTCTRNVESSSDMKTNFSYKLYYEGEYIKKADLEDVITFSNKDTLKKYKEAYENSYSKYKNIDYYDNNITVKNLTLISKTIIDYTKVDTSKIIEIEGEKDNIFEDGKVSLKKTLTLYKQAGLECKK